MSSRSRSSRYSHGSSRSRRITTSTTNSSQRYSESQSDIRNSRRATTFSGFISDFIPQITELEAIYIWSNSVLLATHYNISESLLEHKRLLQVCGNTIPRSLIYFNIGSLLSIAGDIDLSTQAYEESCREDPSLSLAWFCLGVNHFSAGQYVAAVTAFETCIACYAETERVKNYESQGLNLKLEKTKVTWNLNLSRQNMDKENGIIAPVTHNYPLNRIRKDLFFNAPEVGSEREEGHHISSSDGDRRKSGTGEKIRGQFQKLRTSLSGPKDLYRRIKRDSGIGEDTTSASPRSSYG
ncbi:hypothetical protein FQN54_008393 [Arachnomyces sp. PD_36]|nr:hypothetical protein FQN54_008393 [Arachnomyces sp. PD_36]